MPKMRKNYGWEGDPQVAQRDIRDPLMGQHVGGGLVTVVIPCYNQAHFLGEAIESVLAQSYKDFELVVVDDGSTDNSSEVARRYPSVRLIRQENQGLSGARNTGLRHSEGEYLVFLDADDRLLPEALEVGVRELEAHPECAFAYGHYRYVTADGSFLKQPRQHVVTEDSYVKLLQGNSISLHATVMYRRFVFEAVGGFDTSLSSGEDWEHFLRVARKYPICCCENVVAECRKHGTNMSLNYATMLSHSMAVLRSQQRHVKGNKRYERAIESGVRTTREYYGRLLARKVLTNLRNRDWKQAVEDLPVLVRYYPQVFLRGCQKLGSRYLRRWLRRSVRS